MKIRRIAQDNDAISIQEELDLFIDDRRWDVETNILPALRSGTTVVMDRYYYSNACYQGARGLDMEAILRANREFAPEPDIVFIIDVDVERALERIDRHGPASPGCSKKRISCKRSAPTTWPCAAPTWRSSTATPAWRRSLGDVLLRYGKQHGTWSPPLQ